MDRKREENAASSFVDQVNVLLAAPEMNLKVYKESLDKSQGGWGQHIPGVKSSVRFRAVVGCTLNQYFLSSLCLCFAHRRCLFYST